MRNAECGVSSGVSIGKRLAIQTPHSAFRTPHFGVSVTQLPRVMTLRDVVLFNITAIVGLRWLTTAGRIGPASLALWVIAMVIFFLPSAMAVRELTDIDPGEGGIYRWATRAFGPRHGFLAGWGYWVNNLVYYPSLLLTSGAIVAYVGGAGFVHLAENKWFIAAFSLANLWIAVGLNLVGLRVGKWVQNLGAYGTWLPAAIFVLLALWSFATHGSATPFTARALVPTHLDLPLLSLFATMTFAFAGLELAPTLGDEIRDPVATLRRGIVLSGIGVVAMYLLGTAAMLVALPAETVSVTNGMPQATAVLVGRLGAAWLAPAAALVALLLTLGNLGGVGAWIAGLRAPGEGGRGDVSAGARRDARGAPRRDGERHQRDAAGDGRPGRATRRRLARARGRPRRPPADARQPRGRGRVDRRDGPDSLRRRSGSRAPARLRQGAPPLADALPGSAGAGRGRHRIRRRGARGLDRARRLPRPRRPYHRAVFHSLPVPLRRLPPAAARTHAARVGGGVGGARRGAAIHRAGLRPRRGPREPARVRSEGRGRRRRVHGRRARAGAPTEGSP